MCNFPERATAHSFRLSAVKVLGVRPFSNLSSTRQAVLADSYPKVSLLPLLSLYKALSFRIEKRSPHPAPFSMEQELRTVL